MDEVLRKKLLGDLISMLNMKLPSTDLNHLWVHFFTKRGRLVTDTLSVPKALDCLFGDVYLFEDFDLRDAVRLSIQSH